MFLLVACLPWHVNAAVPVTFSEGIVGTAEGLTPAANVVIEPVVRPPGAPTGLTGWFYFLTRTSETTQPSIHLQWMPSIENDYLLKGYDIRIARNLAELGDALPGEMIESSQWVDSGVEVDRAYVYTVRGVDARGNSSTPSQPLIMDLRALSSQVLAPPVPQGLTATSNRTASALSWNKVIPNLDPVSAYIVYRGVGPSLGVQKEIAAVGEPGYTDLDVSEKTIFHYRVAAKDTSGRVSAMSLTVSAGATGTLPPSAPRNLTSVVKVENVGLSWEAAADGTAPVSEYFILREGGEGPDGSPAVEMLRPKKPLDLKYTDKDVDGNEMYRYEVYAVDVEGNTSPAVSLFARPEPEPYDWSSIFIMPTAFSNNPGKSLRGFNLNILFDFYVGSLYEEFDGPFLAAKKTGVFQRIQTGTFTGDLKYSPWGDQKYFPSLAVGFYGVTLLNLGQPTAGGTGTSVAANSSSEFFETFGAVYLSGSKRLWGKTAVHAGYMRGRLSSSLAEGYAKSRGWDKTIRHLTPYENMPVLMTRLINPNLNVPIDTPEDLVYAGLVLPFRFPFTKWKTAWRTEISTPVADERGSEKLPILITTNLDGARTFGFNFGWTLFFRGWGVVAYYHFKDLNWAW